MARVISLCNQKGGVGKSTTALNLAAYLSAMGKFILIVDLDPQANTTSGLGLDFRGVGKSIYEVIIGQSSMKDVIRKSGVFGLDIAPANPNLAAISVEVVNDEDREFKLRKAISSVRTDYDYIIIDSPPSLGLLTINALVASDFVLIPVQCEYYALEGLGQLLGTINLIQQNLQPDLQILGALLTMYDKRNKLARQIVKEVQLHFPGRVFSSVIPRSVRLAEAPSHGKTILQYDSWSRGARAYKQLAAEVVAIE